MRNNFSNKVLLGNFYYKTMHKVLSVEKYLIEGNKQIQKPLERTQNVVSFAALPVSSYDRRLNDESL